MDSANQLARIAIERESADQALKSSEESLRVANEQIVRTNEILEQRVADRTQELEAETNIIRANEERFRDLTALSSDWYWEQDAEFRFTVISGMKAINVEQQHALGMTRWERGYTALSQTWEEHRALCEAHKPIREFEFLAAGTDGVTHHIRISGNPIFDSTGGFAGYRGVGQDITQSQRALIALQESETPLSTSGRACRPRVLGVGRHRGQVVRCIGACREHLRIFRRRVSRSLHQPGK